MDHVKKIIGKDKQLKKREKTSTCKDKHVQLYYRRKAEQESNAAWNQRVKSNFE